MHALRRPWRDPDSLKLTTRGPLKIQGLRYELYEEEPFDYLKTSGKE
jgi:hypothetical protein